MATGSERAECWSWGPASALVTTQGQPVGTQRAGTQPAGTRAALFTAPRWHRRRFSPPDADACPWPGEALGGELPDSQPPPSHLETGCDKSAEDENPRFQNPRRRQDAMSQFKQDGPFSLALSK